MSESVDVIVVGGGMAGCMTAYYLAEQGVRVAVIEPSGVGQQASGNSAGGLNPLHGQGIPGPLSELAMESFGLHLALWKRLQQAGTAGFYPRRVKRLFLAFDPASLESYTAACALYGRYAGFAAWIIEAAAVRRLESRINPAVVGALYTEGNAAVEPLAYNQAIAEAAFRHGVQLVEANATGLVLHGGTATDVVTDKGSIACGHVVIATGAWSQAPAHWLGVPIPVEPLKGEMLLLDIPGDPLGYDITLKNFSLFCRGQAYVWIGATETTEGYDSLPTAGARQTLLAQGSEIMPAIAQAKVLEHTVGLRPVTPDGLPIIGKAPGYDNVYLNTGAGKKGTLLSAGMGKAVADLITAGCTALSIARATPDRF